MPSFWPIFVCGFSGIRIAAQYQVTRAESNRRVIKKSHVRTAAVRSLQVKGAFHSNFCFLCQHSEPEHREQCLRQSESCCTRLTELSGRRRSRSTPFHRQRHPRRQRYVRRGAPRQHGGDAPALSLTESRSGNASDDISADDQRNLAVRLRVGNFRTRSFKVGGVWVPCVW